MNLRTRLRAAPLAALAFAALCFVAAFTTTALPRAVDSYGNAALRDALASAPLSSRLVAGTLPVEPRLGDGRQVRTPNAQPSRIDRLGEEFADAAHALPVDADRAVAGVANPDPAEVDRPALTRLMPAKEPEVTLAAQRGLADHSRLVRGDLPGPEVGFRQIGSGPQARYEEHVEAVVTVRTARRMGLAPGDTFRIGTQYATVVTVTGIVEPRDPGSVFWQAKPELAHPVRASRAPTSPGAETERYWHFGALLHREAADALPGDEMRAEAYWYLPLHTDGLRAHQVPDLLTGLVALDRGPESAELARVAGSPVTVDEELASLLGEFERDRSAVAPLLAMAAVGVTTAALTVLVLWGVLTAERRRDELELLRARGSSVPRLAGVLLAETAASALPAVAAGYGAAWWLLPDARTARSLLLAGAVAAVALATLPLRASAVHRRPLAAVARRGGPGGRGGRRRLVAEGTVLVLVVGAVVALRQRGAGGTGGESGVDPLPAAAPVLLSLAAALLLLRCYPLPLRLLARASARRPGPVAFLGLARAGRAPSAAVTGLPLLSLLVALTVASFGGTVLAGVDGARHRAALLAVGAEARIASPSALPGELAGRVREVPGVGEVSGVRSYGEAGLLTGLLQPTLVIADPVSYARLSARTGLGAYPAEALEGGRGGTVPALISADLAAEWGGDTMDLTVPGLGVSAQPVLVRESTPAVPNGTFVVVSRAALERAQPDVAGTALVRPNVLLLGAEGGTPVDAGALRTLTDGAGPTLTLNLAAEERAAYDDSEIRSGAEDLYAAAVAAAAALSALAVLLSLLQTAPERTALLARLRTLGMPRRQGRWLILVEALPLYALTAAAGSLLALASVPLLRPGIDLAALAGTPPSSPVRLGADVLSLVLPALCLLTLAAAALLLQARAAAGRADLRMEPS